MWLRLMTLEVEPDRIKFGADGMRLSKAFRVEPRLVLPNCPGGRRQKYMVQGLRHGNTPIRGRMRLLRRAVLVMLEEGLCWGQVGTRPTFSADSLTCSCRCFPRTAQWIYQSISISGSRPTTAHKACVDSAPDEQSACTAFIVKPSP